MGGIRYRFGVLGLAMVVATSIPERASGQAATQEALECFAEANRAGTLRCDPKPAISVGEVMLSPDEYPEALVREIAQGLQAMATSDSRRLRIAAANWLALKGERSEAQSVKTIDELDEIYFNARFEDVRTTIASRMHLQLARSRAISFLEKAASTSLPEEVGSDWPSSYVAINALTRMGENGRQALRRISAAGTVTNPTAKGYLKHLAASGFRTSQE